jgi:4-amino-4-deoxy-L-arabinose transferase-like glycosyltransferase
MFNSQTKPYWLLFVIATLSFLPTLHLYYIGEEAIFPIASQEMWEHGYWIKQTLYGRDQMHTPLFNWLIIAGASVAGWEYLQGVTRLITICSTVFSAGILTWLAQRIFQHKPFSVFAGLTFFTFADVLWYRGWLSYVDPLFAMFVFAAIATLWVGAHEKRLTLIALSGVLLTCAFLSKALTAYIFYGGTLFVLLFESQQRQFLLRWQTMLLLIFSFSGCLIWYAAIPEGMIQAQRMLAEMSGKLANPGVLEYLARLVWFPAKVLLWLSPPALLALYLWYKRQYRAESNPLFKLSFYIAISITVVNFLPYWISPHGGIRYLEPLYPLVALIAARVIWQSGELALQLAKKWIIAVLILKFLLVLIVFPYYQSEVRGKNYDEAAQNILQHSQTLPLYVTDVSSAGLNVAAYVNLHQLPKTALQWPPKDWETGFVISRTNDPALGALYKHYPLGGDDIYLLCRGSACTNP